MKRAQLLKELEEVGPGGHALALQIMGSREDAADAMQDVLAKLLGKLSYDSREGSFRTWVLAVGRNRCIDLLRQRGRRPEVPGAEVELLATTEHSPESAILLDEMAQIVRRELSRLPLQQREILILREYLNLSYSEIAKILDVPPGTVMSRLHRARLALAELMREARYSL